MNKKNSLVFNLGAEAGFFSEFNNMIFAILFCQKNGLMFRLFSKGSKLSKDIWNDYFDPFCSSANNPLNAIFNSRQPHSIPNAFSFKFGSTILKFLQGGYLTYELWPQFRDKSFFNEHFILEGKDYSFIDASNYILNSIWKFNPKTRKEIDEEIKRCNLPREYVGIHIRRGDKIMETESTGINVYMNKLQSITDCKDVFVMTDDYSVIESITTQYPSYTFYYLAKINEKGYIHSEFCKMPDSKKRDGIIHLLSEMEILSHAQKCIGTYSSNPGLFLALRMGEERFHGIDFNKFYVW